MQIVILDNDENTEFKPFSIAVSIDTIGDLAELINRLEPSYRQIKSVVTSDEFLKETADVEDLMAIRLYLRAKYKVFAKCEKRQAPRKYKKRNKK